MGKTRTESEKWAKEKAEEFVKSGSNLTFAEWCYQQGRADAFQEIAYSDSVIKEPFEILVYKKGKVEGAREFAELLKKKFNEFIDYDDDGEQTFESNPDLVWIVIDEVLSECRKEAENDRTRSN